MENHRFEDLEWSQSRGSTHVGGEKCAHWATANFMMIQKYYSPKLQKYCIIFGSSCPCSIRNFAYKELGRFFADYWNVVLHRQEPIRVTRINVHDNVLYFQSSMSHCF